VAGPVTLRAATSRPAAATDQHSTDRSAEATPKRIAVNASIVGERPTGLGFYALYLITALDELGELLSVYTSRPDLVAARRATVTPIPASVRPERGTLGHLRRLIWTQTGLRQIVRRERPRLLLNMMPEGLVRSPAPQVTIVHDLLPLLYPAEYPRQQHYFRHLVPAVLRHSNAIIVISESTRRDLVRFYPEVSPDTVHVVLSGYDARRFPPETEHTAAAVPYALYVGNILPHKNLHVLVEAFAIAARQIPGRLVIRGSGRSVHVRALRDRIAKLGLWPRVEWESYASPEELARLYQQASMLLLPSLHEGFGLTALEAMACGTPVITSNTSSLPEVVGDAALLVDPLDTQALADAVLSLFTDQGLARELSARGRRRAGEFSWDKTGRAVQAVIHRVLGEE
jgi:glycosyltransferase involved in cell wall biosynthesis